MSTNLFERIQITQDAKTARRQVVVQLVEQVDPLQRPKLAEAISLALEQIGLKVDAVDIRRTSGATANKVFYSEGLPVDDDDLGKLLEQLDAVVVAKYTVVANDARSRATATKKPADTALADALDTTALGKKIVSTIATVSTYESEKELTRTQAEAQLQKLEADLIAMSSGTPSFNDLENHLVSKTSTDISVDLIARTAAGSSYFNGLAQISPASKQPESLRKYDETVEIALIILFDLFQRATGTTNDALIAQEFVKVYKIIVDARNKYSIGVANVPKFRFSNKRLSEILVLLETDNGLDRAIRGRTGLSLDELATSVSAINQFKKVKPTAAKTSYIRLESLVPQPSGPDTQYNVNLYDDELVKACMVDMNTAANELKNAVVTNLTLAGPYYSSESRLTSTFTDIFSKLNTKPEDLEDTYLLEVLVVNSSENILRFVMDNTDLLTANINQLIANPLKYQYGFRKLHKLIKNLKSSSKSEDKALAVLLEKFTKSLLGGVPVKIALATAYTSPDKRASVEAILRKLESIDPDSTDIIIDEYQASNRFATATVRSTAGSLVTEMDKLLRTPGVSPSDVRNLQDMLNTIVGIQSDAAEIEEDRSGIRKALEDRLAKLRQQIINPEELLTRGEKIRTRIAVLPLSGVGRDTRESIAQARISVAREQSTEITEELENILKAEESVIQIKKTVGEIQEYMKNVMLDTSLTSEQRVAKIIAFAQPKIRALERVKTDFTGSLNHPVRARANEIITNIRESDRQITQASNYVTAKTEIVEAHRRRFNNKRGIMQILFKIGALFNK